MLHELSRFTGLKFAERKVFPFRSELETSRPETRTKELSIKSGMQQSNPNGKTGRDEGSAKSRESIPGSIARSLSSIL
jgi:hypothetical protein